MLAQDNSTQAANPELNLSRGVIKTRFILISYFHISEDGSEIE